MQCFSSAFQTLSFAPGLAKWSPPELNFSFSVSISLVKTLVASEITFKLAIPLFTTIMPEPSLKTFDHSRRSAIL